MLPTLPNGSIAVADADAYRSRAPERGDIVVMHPPNDASLTFVKRVIGVPGDIIEIDGAQKPTAVLIEPQGQAAFKRLREPYLPEPWTAMTSCCQPDGTETASAMPETILAGYYFVLGDNRNRSSDSRSFGFVPASDILGKIIGISGSSVNLYANRPTLV
jgi:signal peptidase I